MLLVCHPVATEHSGSKRHHQLRGLFKIVVVFALTCRMGGKKIEEVSIVGYVNVNICLLKTNSLNKYSMPLILTGPVMNPVGKSLGIKKDAAAIQRLACVCDDLAES